MMILSKKTFYILAAAVLLISGVAQSKVVNGAAGAVVPMTSSNVSCYNAADCKKKLEDHCALNQRCNILPINDVDCGDMTGSTITCTPQGGGYPQITIDTGKNEMCITNQAPSSGGWGLCQKKDRFVIQAVGSGK